MGSVKRLAKSILRSQNVPFSDEIVDLVSAVGPGTLKKFKGVAHTREGRARQRRGHYDQQTDRFTGRPHPLARVPGILRGKLRLGPIGRINKVFRNGSYAKKAFSSGKKKYFRRGFKKYGKAYRRKYRKSSFRKKFSFKY